MSKLLFNKAFIEHSFEDVSSVETIAALSILFKGKEDCKCVEIIQEGTSKKISFSCYIGTDWLERNEVAVYVAPKLNDTSQQTDYLGMLFSCLRHSDVLNFTQDLYEIKFEEPLIEIEQQRDLLTPILIVHFLQALKVIVRKGLKRSYYKIEQPLNSKIKGKILVSKTIKQCAIKIKPTQNYCQYQEFGINCAENRILKKTLIFVQKYLALMPAYSGLISPIINYCSPAFQEVNENIDLNAAEQVAHSSFYNEYKEALHTSGLILRRFGYNIKEVEAAGNRIIKVPPFWINMPKLFELYVLGMLKDKYHNDIKFQIQGTYGQPDFLLVKNNSKMIIDTKYKRRYQQEKYQSEDIRQLSGYARDSGILSQLGYKTKEEQNTVVDCLIIYPDQAASGKLADDLKANPIAGFTSFYKMAIKLPVINSYHL
jgi:5-methylcytosine-specific restriction endonuclease McrBC regulatory subunit McrC